jgi:DNA primase
MRQEDKCFITEGYTDVLMLHQNGIKNTVASSGTALTEDQVALLRRFTNNITILFDGDAAGLKAAQRGINIMLDQDVNVRIVALPEGQDPDSFLRENGTQNFKDFIRQNEKDFILFKSSLLLEEGLNDPIKKASLIKEIVTSIALVKDSIKRAVYIQQCASLFEISEDAIINELNKAIRQDLYQKQKKQHRDQLIIDRKTESESISKPPQKSSGQTKFEESNRKLGSHEAQERDIIRILIRGGTKQIDEAEDIRVAHLVIEEIRDVVDHFENPVYRRIIDIYEEMLANNQIPESNFFIQHEDEEIQNLAVDLLYEPYQFSDNWEKKFDITLQTQPMPDDNFYKDAYESLMRLKLRKIDLVIKSNLEVMNSLDSYEDKKAYLAVHSELNKTRNQIAKQLNSIILPQSG